MVDLRCSKCGSNAGFLIETSSGQTLEVKGTLSTDRIQKTVHVTCTYCNSHWDEVPITLQDRRLADPFGKRVTH